MSAAWKMWLAGWLGCMALVACRHEFPDSDTAARRDLRFVDVPRADAPADREIPRDAAEIDRPFDKRLAEKKPTDHKQPVDQNKCDTAYEWTNVSFSTLSFDSGLTTCQCDAECTTLAVHCTYDSGTDKATCSCADNGGPPSNCAPATPGNNTCGAICPELGAWCCSAP